jgi:hypothetical protein
VVNAFAPRAGANVQASDVAVVSVRDARRRLQTGASTVEYTVDTESDVSAYVASALYRADALHHINQVPRRAGARRPFGVHMC